MGGCMAQPEFRCERHNQNIYGPAHITEHKAIEPGRCDIVRLDVEPIDVPGESRFDITDDPRSA